jgi:hypothetical protein
MMAVKAAQMIDGQGGLWEAFAEPAAATFLLQFHTLLGVLEGLELAGRAKVAAWPLVAELRLDILAKIKALCAGLQHEEAPRLVAQAMQGHERRLAGLEEVAADAEVLLLFQEAPGGPQ